MPPAVNPWLALPDGAARPGPHPAAARCPRAAGHRHRTPADDAVAARWSATPGAGRWAAASTPTAGAPPVDLLDDDLLAYREAHPLATVMPVIRRLLVEDAEDDRMIVAVTDAGGRMLWVEGDSAAALAGRRACTSSRAPAGPRTSPAPTPPAPRWPSTTPSRSTAASTSAVPSSRGAARPPRCTTRSPASLLGAIDVTGGDHVASPHVLTLVRATVAAVESELRWQHREQLQRGRRRRPPPPQRPAPRLEVLGRERARLTPAERAGRAVAAALRAPAAARRGRRRGGGPHRRPAGRRVPPRRRRGGHRAGRAVPAAPAGRRRPGRLPALPPARPPRHRPRPGAPAAGPRLGRLGAGALPGRRAARLARAGRGRGPRAGGARCSARPSCAAAVPSCCCATRSCPRPGTTSPSGRPASSGCRRARRAAPRRPPHLLRLRRRAAPR